MAAGLAGLWAAGAAALDNGLGRTPPMGWNSWNKFGCQVSEDLVKATADAMVSSGMRDAGYVYVNIDDCWEARERDKDGNLQPDPELFPSGMRALGEYIHKLGLKFGIYSSAGFYTCQSRPGSLGFEEQDAAQFARWGVDYLKYDNCFNGSIDPELRFGRMSQALNATGRPMFYSVCEWGVNDPAAWAPALANSWRTTPDIADNWMSIANSIIEQNQGKGGAAQAGAWNDPDMLEVGNGGMTHAEYRTHMSLWAIMKAPLLVGCDVRNMTAATKELLLNAEVIAVNQDPLGVQGRRVKQLVDFAYGTLDIWAAPLASGDLAVVLSNMDMNTGKAHEIALAWEDIGLGAAELALVRDLWQHAELGLHQGSFKVTVAAHDSVMLRVTPLAGRAVQ